MKFPFFATTTLIAIFCAMLLLKSFDYGKAWAIVLAAVGLLLFTVLTIIALQYQMRQHDDNQDGEAH
jgi:cell division protein FtsW (lipid II flippase)